MIQVTARKKGIEVIGHAGYAPPGQDIVCAGVTALTLNLLKGLKSLTKDKIEYQVNDGYVMIIWRNLSKTGKVLVDSFFLGICGIASDYPDCVQIN